MTKRAGSAGSDESSVSPALGSLFDETRALFHRLRLAAEQIHQQGELSAARRGVLISLQQLGPLSVPQMARARPVSRQHIQVLVNSLADDGLVEAARNPAHKRSPHFQLTPRGERLVRVMERREARVVAQLEIGIPDTELRAAAAVLREVRKRFEGRRFDRLVEDSRGAKEPRPGRGSDAR